MIDVPMLDERPPDPPSPTGPFSNRGPNVQRIVLRRASVLLVPRGTGIEAAVSAITDAARLPAAISEALNWADESFEKCRLANPRMARMNDEAVAAELLRVVNSRRHLRRPRSDEDEAPPSPTDGVIDKLRESIRSTR